MIGPWHYTFIVMEKGPQLTDEELVSELIRRIENPESIGRDTFLGEARNLLPKLKDKAAKTRLEETLRRYR